MKVRLNEHALPREFSRLRAAGLVAEFDVSPHPHGRLKAKVLVFKTMKALHQFWKGKLGQPHLSFGCVGVVSSLMKEIYGTGLVECDPRYFCVMGLCLKDLSMEVITHESAHAGFAYYRRLGRNMFGEASEPLEEGIAYPVGRIAAEINRFCYRLKLYSGL